ncbi:hypothetical protein F183_A27950 [Bryobacterales bacterium F-183]|nr:hypothetical protein F183_A27950 [Bryobacterales bacterium F-183]
MSSDSFRFERGASSSIALSFRDSGGTQAQTSSSVPDTFELEIDAAAPTLQTESAEVSRAYNTSLIRQLPVEDRQAQELVGLMPGVTPPVTSSDRILDPQRRREFQVNGLPSFANNFHLDGGYMTDPANGNAVRIAPNEALQSLDVRTSNYNAEYGFSAGAWTNTVTRPGQNAVHGSVFGFHTNSFFNTRNPLDNGQTPVTPRFNQNQFGGSLGGPVWRNSVFAFASYEGFLRRGSTLDIQTVPTADFRNGIFTGGNAVVYDPLSGAANGTGRTPFFGNQIPLNRVNPFASGLLGLLPTANRSGSFNNLIGVAGLRDDTHRGDMKIDHRLSQNAYGFFRYGYTQAEVSRGSVLGSLGNAADASLRNHAGVASISYSFTPNLMGELRGSFFRYRNQISPVAATPELSSLLNTNFGGNTFPGGLPQISIGGFSTIGLSSAYFSKPITNIWDGATNWVFHTGMHNLKFGASGRVMRSSGFDAGIFGPRGSLVFGPGSTLQAGGTSTFNGNDVAANSFASFLLGRSSVSGVSSYLTTPTLQQEQYSAHLTDTIQLWSRLSLELGVRYEVYSPYRTQRTGSNQIFDPSTGTVSNATVNSVYDLNNVAPRVGMALRLFDRLAVRGGYGIHFFPFPLAYAGLNQAVTGAQSGISGGFGSNPTFGLPNVPDTSGTPGNNAAPNVPYTVTDRTRETPYIQTYSFMVQGDLGQGFLLDVGYVGNRGRQLPLLSQLNAALPGAGLAGLPFAQFNRTAATTGLTSGLNSNYNSLQVNLTKRFAKGLSFTGAYTFGKALDYGQSVLISSNNRNLNYGPADWDRRHMLSLSHVWRLPFGTSNRYFTGGVLGSILGDWEFNGMLRWATGTPYAVSLDPLACNCPGLSGGLFATQTSTSGSFDGSTSFDPSSFSVTAGQLGGGGRNTFRGPELFSYDAALFKNFAVRESVKLELRGEVYNVTNNANYASPVSSALSPGFGTSNSLFNNLAGRRFQVAARILF